MCFCHPKIVHFFSLKDFAALEFPSYGLSGDCHEYFPEKTSNISCSVSPLNWWFYLLFPSWISLTFPSCNLVVLLYPLEMGWPELHDSSTGRLVFSKGLVSWHFLLCPPPFQVVGNTACYSSYCWLLGCSKGSTHTCTAIPLLRNNSHSLQCNMHNCFP